MSLVQPIEQCEKFQVLSPGQPPCESPAFRQYSLKVFQYFSGLFLDIDVIDECFTAIGDNQRAEDFNESSFAGAIRPKQPENLTLANLQVYAAESFYEWAFVPLENIEHVAERIDLSAARAAAASIFSRRGWISFD